MRNAWVQFAAGMAVIAVILVAISGNEYWVELATSGLLFAGLASAWNIIGGFGGQFSLGHGVFFATGAYSVALLQVNNGWSPWLAMLFGAVLSALTAALLAGPIFRLRGPFLAIGTLALNMVALSLANYFDFTGGPLGARLPFTEAVIQDYAVWPWAMFAFLVLCAGIALAIKRTRLGYYLIAVREDEDAADASGANPLAVKTLGLVISAALTGLGGGLFVSYVGFIDPPSALDLADIGARIPLLALIGGMGTVAGPIIGALIVQPGELYLRGELSAAPPGLSLMLVGLLFVIAARFFPRGIWGALSAALERRRQGAEPEREAADA